MADAILIVFGGFAGAGKSTLATRLSKEHKFPVFNPDVINDALRLSQGWDFHKAAPVSYEVMWHLIKKQLDNGVTVILDTNMCSDRTWKKIDDIRQSDVEVIPIILQCTLEKHRERIHERGQTSKEHLNLGGDSLEDVLFKYEYIEKLQRDDLIRVDANGTADQTYDAVREILTSKDVS